MLHLVVTLASFNLVHFHSHYFLKCFFSSILFLSSRSTPVAGFCPLESEALLFSLSVLIEMGSSLSLHLPVHRFFSLFPPCLTRPFVKFFYWLLYFSSFTVTFLLYLFHFFSAKLYLISVILVSVSVDCISFI